VFSALTLIHATVESRRGSPYVKFPGSGNGMPRALSEIVSISQAHFQQWGGLPMLQAVSMSVASFDDAFALETSTSHMAIYRQS
jgi:hypothetical protein